MKNKVDLFLDSGAFSAHTKGVIIDINDYIQFIKDNRDNISVYANLDVIGDAEATWQNQLKMEEAGLMPIPCFHLGEDLSYLRKYVDRYEYIALGGLAHVGKNKWQLFTWLNRCWDIICDEDGYPKVKVHGFAVTTLKVLCKYPWYSVDSTSWVLTGRFGSIYVPETTNKGYVYGEKNQKISVSLQNPNIKKHDQHFSTFGPKTQERILQYIHDRGFKMGKSHLKKVTKDYVPDASKGERWYNRQDAEALREMIDRFHAFVPGEYLVHGKDDEGNYEIEIIDEPGISNDYKERDAMNIMYFLDFEKNYPPYEEQWWDRSSLLDSFGFSR